LTALTYIGVGLFVLGWLVLFLLSLSGKPESDTRYRQSYGSIPQTNPHGISKTVNHE
jgi:hypothetical protein